MMALRTKMYVAAAIPAALSAAIFYLSTTARDGDAAFLYRLGLTVAIGGFLICLVTWDHHRVGELRQDLTIAEQRADDVESRLHLVEEDLQCRRLAREFWAGHSADAAFRDLMQPGDN